MLVGQPETRQPIIRNILQAHYIWADKLSFSSYKYENRIEYILDLPAVENSEYQIVFSFFGNCVEFQAPLLFRKLDSLETSSPFTLF